MTGRLLPLVESRTGQARTVNEDRFLCEPNLPLYAVLDGHGASGYAADLAIEGLRAFGKARLDSRGIGPDETAEALVAAVHSINRRVLELSVGRRRGCGTTLTCCALVGGVAVVVHVGDSRLFLRQGDAWRLVTRDHTLLEDTRRSGSQANVAEIGAYHAGVITRAVGVAPAVQVDVSHFTVSPGDGLLLCTDGAWRNFDRNCVGAPPPALEAAALLDWIFEQYALHGESDNATVARTFCMRTVTPASDARDERPERTLAYRQVASCAGPWPVDWQADDARCETSHCVTCTHPAPIVLHGVAPQEHAVPAEQHTAPPDGLHDTAGPYPASPSSMSQVHPACELPVAPVQPQEKQKHDEPGMGHAEGPQQSAVGAMTAGPHGTPLGKVCGGLAPTHSQDEPRPPSAGKPHAMSPASESLPPDPSPELLSSKLSPASPSPMPAASLPSIAAAPPSALPPATGLLVLQDATNTTRLASEATAFQLATLSVKHASLEEIEKLVAQWKG
jgi:serine/threonine protein phosphatase PrpC